jgi:aryl-alcohol dehydrogenase-like predicted oxidoreductase
VPAADQLGTLEELQAAGKIRYLGLSEVSVDELEKARKIIEVKTVQNQFNLVMRKSEAVLDHCEKNGIGFIPWFPIATGELAKAGGPMDAVCRQLKATPAQVALAWLLRRSKVMLAIPGTGSVAHLEENMGAAKVELNDAQFKTLSALG